MAKLDIIISVDWEGTSLEEKNLASLRDFKKRYHVPFLHYMNPAYFTHPALKNRDISSQLNRCIFEDDEMGLHLHGPRHLIEQCGVKFRSQPSFTVQGDAHEGAMRGQEVMLHTYNQSEFSQLLFFSTHLFKKQGWSDLKSFRAGGWMISPEQVRCLSDFGFKFDSSAVSPQSLVGTSWEGESLHRYSEILWGHISHASLPYWVGHSEILEVPNNLGAIDYWSSQHLHYNCQESASLAKNKGYHLVVVTAHQETFHQYCSRLEKFINELISDKNLEVNFTLNKQLIPTRYQTPSTWQNVGLPK